VVATNGVAENQPALDAQAFYAYLQSAPAQAIMAR